MNTWIEITDDAGEVEAVCTLAEFLAANECFGDEQVAELNALTHLDAERLNAFLALAFDTLEAQRKAGKPRLSQVERAVDSVVNYLDALEG